MSSLLDASQVQAQIEDYLDYLCAPLLGTVPHSQRQRFRREAADHLLGLAEDFAAEGLSPEDAVSHALHEYGDPWRLGQSFADAWRTSEEHCYRLRFADAATVRAFGWFGIFTVANLLLLEATLFQPGASWWQPDVACLAVASPLIAGILTGLGLHSQMRSGIFRSVGTLAAASGAVGLLLLPRWEGVQFAAFQLFFWLPVGSLSATVTAGLAHQFRLRHFPRTIR